MTRYDRYAPVILRVSLAALFGYAGLLKWLALGSTSQMLASLGFPAASFFGWLLTLIEPVGAVLLLLGLGTRYVAPVLAIIPFLGIFVVSLPNWSDPLMQVSLFQNLVVIGALASLALHDAGPFSLSMEKKR